VSTDAGQGVGEGEWDAGNSVGGSPGRERWCGGAVVVGKLGGEGAPAWTMRRGKLGVG
jgi:hypothetical protein